jgi:hypothetical protein
MPYDEGMQNRVTPVVLALPAAATLALLASACRAIPPDSGTPPQPRESLDEGVARSQHVGGTRPVSILVSAERVAADVSELIGSATPVRIRVMPTENRTALPESSFGHLRRQLVRSIVDAGGPLGLDFVTGKPADEGGEPAAYLLYSRVVGSLRGDNYFLFDYRLVRNGSDRADAVWTANHTVASG